MKKGVLIIGYGTRTGNLREILETQAARLRARGRGNVYIGYFRVTRPTIEEAMARMVKDGCDSILGIPYYIAEGRMTLEKIPGKMGLGAASVADKEMGGKKVRIALAPAFGMTRALTGSCTDRIAEVGGRMDDGILIFGHGSRDVSRSNEAIVRLNADRLRKIGYRHVQDAYNEFNDTGISEGIDILAGQGVKRIVCVPMFIAAGVHLGEEIPDKIGIPRHSKGGAIERGGRKIEVLFCDPIGADPRLLEIMDSQIGDFLGE